MAKEYSSTWSRREFLRRSALTAAGVPVLGLLGAACGDDEPSPSNVSLIMPFQFLPSMAATLIAAAPGQFFDQAGLDVTPLPAANGPGAVQQVLAGNALMSRAAGIDILQAVGTQDIPLLSVGDIEPPPFFAISHEDRPVSSPSEMVGKKVGVISVGGNVEKLLDMMLADAGIEPASVEREGIGNAPGAFALIEQEAIDVWIPSLTPWTILRENNTPMHFWDTADFAPIPGQVYIIDKRSLPVAGEAVEKVVKGLQQAIQSVRDDAPDFAESIGIMKDNYEVIAIDDPNIVTIMEEQVQRWLTYGADNILSNDKGRWDLLQDMAIKAELIPAKVPDADLWTNDFWTAS